MAWLYIRIIIIIRDAIKARLVIRPSRATYINTRNKNDLWHYIVCTNNIYYIYIIYNQWYNE